MRIVVLDPGSSDPAWSASWVEVDLDAGQAAKLENEEITIRDILGHPHRPLTDREKEALGFGFGEVDYASLNAGQRAVLRFLEEHGWAEALRQAMLRQGKILAEHLEVSKGYLSDDGMDYLYSASVNHATLTDFYRSADLKEFVLWLRIHPEYPLLACDGDLRFDLYTDQELRDLDPEGWGAS